MSSKKQRESEKPQPKLPRIYTGRKDRRVNAAVITPEMATERDARKTARMMAPPSVTLLGDPPPGYSALDEKRRLANA